MPVTLKRKTGVSESDEENIHTEKKAKTSRSFLDSEDAEDDDYAEEAAQDDNEDIEYSDEEEPDLTTRTKRNLKELDQITFDNMRVVEAGTIARVEVVNFMCHEYLKIDFGPKINFVIGHNGSGKSAILTAITIALGATANSTNRGKNLSSFIKEGAKVASITIHLTNGGDAPYRPDLFPNVIVIERKIIKDGPSPYKLKNSSGAIISTKKEDLVAILDHMNLMVNNPLTILTQDMARKFLSDSSPEEKYKLFMHGTQLSHLQNDFKGIRESLETARAVLERKKQGLPALQAKANEAKKRHEDINKAKQIEDKIEVLNNELVWAQIILKEKEAIKCKREAQMVKEQENQVKEAYEVAKEKIDKINESIVKVTEDLQAFQNSDDPVADEKDRLAKIKADKEVKLRSFKADLEEINDIIKKTKVQKERVKRTLQAETDKMESSSRIRRNEIEEEIEQLKAKMQEKTVKAKQFRNEQDDLDKEIRQEKARKDELMSKNLSYTREKDEIVNLVRNLQGQRGDRMRAYGSNMPKVLADIQRETRWERRKPVGPFGSTLQLLKPQFADTLESVLNKQLNAFVVETFEDKKLLFNILSNHNMRNIPIVVAEYDMFDYSSGEPDEKYLTCLRALKFNDEWVKRQLITSNKIEKMLLMEDRQLADEIMMSKPHNIDLCFTSEGYKVGGKQGMKTESIDPYRGPPRFQKDLEGEIRKHQAAEREIDQKKQEIASQVREVQATIDELQKRYRDCKGMERRLEQEIQRLEQQIEEKAETLKEDDPVDLTIFEEEIRECEEKIRQKVGQFQDIQSQKNAMLAETKEVMKQLRELETQELEREKHIHEFHKKLEKLEALKREAQDAFELISTEKQTIKLRYETKYNAYVESQRMAEEWTRQAQEDYPERVETQRSPRDIEKDIGYHQELAKNMEDQMGVSAEELRKQTFEILKQWNDADSVVKGMEKLSRSLKKMLSKRVTKWEVFRQYISISATHYFSYYLHMRGDEGKLRFNHDSKKLDIRVSTGDQYVKGSRQKDSRSLSGGEKSFSQISFLLSLWQSISSPVICLDEFDVFMDAINRKQTMKMIMNAASENSSQYILITPQDASNMDPGPYVTVHRLADPERH